MYSVSQDYMTKLFNISKKRRAVRAFLDGVGFDENDIVANTLKYTLQAVGGAEINLGGVFLGQLWLTFTKPFAAEIPRGTWKGKKITLEIGLETKIVQEEAGTEIIDGEEVIIYEDVPVIEYVPIGEFYIEEANHTMDGIEITAYDAMRKFDKTLNLSTTNGSLYSLTNFACRQCGVELGMTREEIEDLPNGEELFSIYPDNDMKTYRDLLSWIAVTMGGYATINREGKLEYRGWHSESQITIGINDRYENGSWSDFETYYTGISVTNIAEQTTSYYHLPYDTGLTMNVGSNPLLQYGLVDTKARQRRSILNALGNFRYVPFKVSAFADVFFDLGDVISFTDGLAGTVSKGCVMRIDFTYSKGVTLQGFGENPALFGAQSKTDKDIAGLMSQQQSNEIRFLKYENIEPTLLGDYGRGGTYLSFPLKVLINSFSLSASKETNIEINSRISLSRQWLVESTGHSGDIITIYRGFEYELDGETIRRNTLRTGSSTGSSWSYECNEMRRAGAKDTVEDTQFILNFEAGGRKTLNVYYVAFIVNSGTGRDYFFRDYLLEEGDVSIVIKGQGLSVEPEWDGLIQVQDEIPSIEIGSLESETITELTPIIDLDIPIPIDIEEAVRPAEIEGLQTMTISESVNILLYRPKNNIIAISGDNFISINGDNITTI